MILSLKFLNKRVRNIIDVVELFDLFLASLTNRLELLVFRLIVLDSFVCVPKRLRNLLELLFLLVKNSFLLFNLGKEVVSLVSEVVGLLLHVPNIVLGLLQVALRSGELFLQVLALGSEVL